MTGPRIGVAISTRNRRELLIATLAEWIKHTPPAIPIIVVDDASDEPIELRSHRAIPFETRNVIVVRQDYRRGIAMTKNRCIAELVDRDVEHLFLADDDIHPVRGGWWQPYVDSPEPHLAYQWPRAQPKDNPWKLIHDDGTHFSIGFPRGVMLYATRTVIDTVGGMDPAHGAWGGEHVEWSQRIHDNGLTTWPFADVCGSDRLWYAHDKASGNTIGSSFPLSERRRMAKANGLQWNKTRPTPFVNYQEGQGVQDYSLGPRVPATEHYALLRHIIGLHPEGVALEFGVGKGESTRIIAERMPVVGFDSFEGLPEDWRPEFPKGSFKFHPPTIPNVRLVIGQFADTLPSFTVPDHVGLVHIDCDLYSSTTTALDHIGPHLKSGTYLCFDEAHGYPGSEDHEWKAWREFAGRTGVGWTVVGHSFEQWAIRLA